MGFVEQIPAVLGTPQLPLGSLLVPVIKGAPTQIPPLAAGFVPVVFDTANNKLWIYNGAWYGVVVT